MLTANTPASQTQRPVSRWHFWIEVRPQRWPFLICLQPALLCGVLAFRPNFTFCHAPRLQCRCIYTAPTHCMPCMVVWDPGFNQVPMTKDTCPSLHLSFEPSHAVNSVLTHWFVIQIWLFGALVSPVRHEQVCVCLGPTIVYTLVTLPSSSSSTFSFSSSMIWKSKAVCLKSRVNVPTREQHPRSNWIEQDRQVHGILVKPVTETRK